MIIKNKKAGKRSGSSTGTPGAGALMVVFAVLCLTVFSILALSTVLADKKLSDKYSESVTTYYEADREAQRVISELRAGRVPDGVENENGVYSFTCKVSETKELQVSVEVQGDQYNIISSRTAYCGDWAADDGLGVWQGN